MTPRTSGWPEWQKSFEGLPPVGWVLRSAVADRWIRLYSLPDGKRLPTTESEVLEVLNRQNLVASATLGMGATVTAWLAHFGDAPPPLDIELWVSASEQPCWRCSESEQEMLEGMRFLERTIVWAPGVLDEEFKLRAVDRLGGLTLFSSALGSAFAPYDGGMDVFFNSPESVASTLRLFPDWVSTHPSGL